MLRTFFLVLSLVLFTMMLFSGFGIVSVSQSKIVLANEIVVSSPASTTEISHSKGTVDVEVILPEPVSKKHLKVKVFCKYISISYGSLAEKIKNELENEVNNWLSGHDCNVKTILQSQSENTIIISVFYE